MIKLLDVKEYYKPNALLYIIGGVILLGIFVFIVSLKPNTQPVQAVITPTPTPVEVTPTPDIGSQAATPSAIEANWPMLRAQFIQGCNKDGTKSKFCTCTIDQMELKLTKVEIVTLALEYQDTGKMPPAMTQAMLVCLDTY